MKRTKCLIGYVLWGVSLLGGYAFAAEIDDEVKNMITEPTETTAGQTLFESVCASCHNKDLSGATGFNLKDGEWIHGSEPSDIVNNIKQGFVQAGMPGFGAVYNDQQIKQITAYILSKREGWQNLTYELYQLDPNGTFDFEQLKGKKPIKTGVLSKNVADYQIPEIKDYAIIFKGDFYAPKNSKSYLSTQNPPYVYLDVSINSKPYERLKQRVALLKGKQTLEIRMMTLSRLILKKHKNAPRTNVSLMVTGDKDRKYFGVSTRGVNNMNANQLNISADKIPVVQRKRVLDLPPFSIVVGLPEKINYAFNPKDCSISGAWTGELLNIGPNVKNRGSDNSLILGQWVFHAPDSIAPEASTCRFDEYSRLGNPRFFFTLDTVKYSVEASVINSNSFNLVYQVIENPNNVASISFALPKKASQQISSAQARRVNDKLYFNLEENQRFSIKINGKG
ncbi:c-type cytochrome [Thalassotalea sp. PLHSN55]|uniref:c-type cytochrome n=1 Tax=Thalassotalea sp. PLHSN55 TaxID=3435888 RepID=UPI003F86CB1E